MIFMLNGKFYIYGLGRSGLASAKAVIDAGGLAYMGDDKDLSQRKDLPKGGIIVAQGFPDNIDAVILAPGIPLTHPEPHETVKAAQAKNYPIYCDIELFYRQYKNYKNAKFISITGTNGKSTVTALMTYVLKRLGADAYACGNFGRAIFDVPTPDQTNNDIYYVIETSSYQADLCEDFKPDIAAFLNLTPDHLDRHGDMKGYFQAKMRLFQKIPDYGTAIIMGDNEYSRQAKEIAKNYYQFSDKEYDEAKEALQNNPYLQGDHNIQNALCVLGALKSLGFEAKKILAEFMNFTGLAHRSEYVGMAQRVQFINDSKATNAEATECALKAYDNIYWLVGGVAKDGGISSLMSCLDGVNHVFIYGQDQKIFTDSVAQTNVSFDVFENMQNALQAAWQMASLKDHKATILLSPAAASFDAFDSFEHRGDIFKMLAEKIILEHK